MNFKAKEVLKWRIVTPVRELMKRHLYPRNVQIFGVGMGKTGTHTIASIYSPYLRAGHEVGKHVMTQKIRAWKEGDISRESLLRYLIMRDARFWLEVDVSQLHFLVLDELLELFPEAKYILTIRHPKTWLDSFFNNYLTWGIHPILRVYRDFYFNRPNGEHPREEWILAKYGFSTLDTLLSYWSNHNKEVLEKVSPDKLFVIRTEDLSEKTEKLIEFGGIKAQRKHFPEKHKFRTKNKYHVLNSIDPEYLQHKIDTNCSDLLEEYF